MRLDDILKTESQNSGQIYLYLDKNFMEAYEVSAYLLQREFWPEIQVLVKYIPNRTVKDVIRVGFPQTSVNARVLDLASSRHLTVQQFAHDVDPVVPLIKNVHTQPEYIVKSFAFQPKSYSVWRQNHIDAYNQASLMLAPSYHRLKVYKDSYDLMNLIMTTVRRFSRDLQLCLGQHLITKAEEIDYVFYCYAQEQEPRQQLTFIEQLQAHYSQLTFLLRLGADQHAYSLHRHIALAESLQKIKRQLELMKKANTKKLTQVT